MSDQSFPYDAFLSYDHDDRPVAYGIQRGLHHIGRRIGQLRALRVFRDSTDLTASADLWGKVLGAKFPSASEASKAAFPPVPVRPNKPAGFA